MLPADPGLARVMRIGGAPVQETPGGISWRDYEDADELQQSTDADGEDDDGWGIVQGKKRMYSCPCSQYLRFADLPILQVPLVLLPKPPVLALLLHPLATAKSFPPPLPKPKLPNDNVKGKPNERLEKKARRMGKLSDSPLSPNTSENRREREWKFRRRKWEEGKSFLGG